MPFFSLTNIYKLEKAHKVGNNQVAFLSNDNSAVVIKGIPANVDLSGKIVEMHTYHASGAQKKVESRPDNIEIYTWDEQGEMTSNSPVKLFKQEDGTYRQQTEKERQKTESGNAAIAAALLNKGRE